MPFVNELVVTVLGGVLTAIIIGLFSRGRRGERRSRTQTMINAPHADARRRGSGFGSFLQLVLAMAGGLAFAMLGGRVIFQSGMLDRGLPMRFGLFLAATLLIWLLLAIMRGRN